MENKLVSIKVDPVKQEIINQYSNPNGPVGTLLKIVKNYNENYTNFEIMNTIMTLATAGLLSKNSVCELPTKEQIEYLCDIISKYCESYPKSNLDFIKTTYKFLTENN